MAVVVAAAVPMGGSRVVPVVGFVVDQGRIVMVLVHILFAVVVVAVVQELLLRRFDDIELAAVVTVVGIVHVHAAVVRICLVVVLVLLVVEVVLVVVHRFLVRCWELSMVLHDTTDTTQLLDQSMNLWCDDNNEIERVIGMRNEQDQWQCGLNMVTDVNTISVFNLV